MKKKILASLLLTTPFLVLASSCNVAVSTSGDKKDNDKKEGNKNNNGQNPNKPLIRESLTLDQKKERVKEYFKNYDYALTGFDFFEELSTTNGEKEEIQHKPDRPSSLITLGSHKSSLREDFWINADIYYFLKDLKWKLSIKKAAGTNEITIYLDDSNGQEVAKYSNSINYFVRKTVPEEEGYPPFYFYFDSYYLYINSETITLLSKEKFKTVSLPATPISNAKGSEKIWNTLKWYDNHLLRKAIDNNRFQWVNFRVRKYFNENKIEWLSKIPLSYFERNDKGEIIEKTDEEHTKWEDFVEYRTVDFDKLKFQDVAQKLEKLNKTTFSLEQFANIPETTLEVTKDNKEKLKEKFGLVLDDSITFDELGPDGKFTIKKLEPSYIENANDEQKYVFCKYLWTLEKDGESFTYTYFMSDFNN